MRSFYAGPRARARRRAALALRPPQRHRRPARARGHAAPGRGGAAALIRVGWLVEPLARRDPAPGRARRRRRPARPLDTGRRAGRCAARGLRRVRAHRGSRGARARRRSPTTRRARSPALVPRARTPRRCCGSRGARSTSATSWSRCACAMRWRPAPRPSRRAATRCRRVDPARRASATAAAALPTPAARRRRRSASGPGRRRCNEWATSGDLTALERELRATPHRGRGRAVRRRRPARDRRADRLHGRQARRGAQPAPARRGERARHRPGDRAARAALAGGARMSRLLVLTTPELAVGYRLAGRRRASRSRRPRRRRRGSRSCSTPRTASSPCTPRTSTRSPRPLRRRLDALRAPLVVALPAGTTDDQAEDRRRAAAADCSARRSATRSRSATKREHDEHARQPLRTARHRNR